MTITRISSMRGCGVFREFDWSADLQDFARYNVIYGWNGSGKTTISRILRALEMRTAPANGEVTVSINGRELKSDAFSEQTLPVRVFNRDFVIESVFPVEGDAVPPIFVVGKEEVEKQKEADALKANRGEAVKRLEVARDEKRVTDRELDSFCILRAKTVKDTLRSSGKDPYNTYDKSTFQERAQRMVTDGDAATIG